MNEAKSFRKIYCGLRKEFDSDGLFSLCNQKPDLYFQTLQRDIALNPEYRKLTHEYLWHCCRTRMSQENQDALEKVVFPEEKAIDENSRRLLFIDKLSLLEEKSKDEHVWQATFMALLAIESPRSSGKRLQRNEINFSLRQALRKP